MRDILEEERKYLVNNVQKQACWDKEHIVYQWYEECRADKSVKLKLIFDLLMARCVLVRVTKKTIGMGIAEKNIQYLDVSEFNGRNMLGTPFVLKRRAISGTVFLDKFLAANGRCEYLLEVEGEGKDKLMQAKEFEILREVTDDVAYYNQNMCVPFEEEDLQQLTFLLQTFLW